MQAEFLQKFASNKKDLSCTKEFISNDTITDREKDCIFEGFVNMYELLKMNGFDGNQMDTAYATTLMEGLIDQAAQEFGEKFKRETAEHPHPMLSKHFYMKHLGKNREYETASSSRTEQKVA